jgi:hypothetical protein
LRSPEAVLALPYTGWDCSIASCCTIQGSSTVMLNGPALSAACVTAWLASESGKAVTVQCPRSRRLLRTRQIKPGMSAVSCRLVTLEPEADWLKTAKRGRYRTDWFWHSAGQSRHSRRLKVTELPLNCFCLRLPVAATGRIEPENTHMHRSLQENFAAVEAKEKQSLTWRTCP